MVAASRHGAGFAEVLLEEHPASRTVCAAGCADSRVRTTHADAAGGVQLVGANGEKRRLLSWAIRNGDGAALRLTETPCAGARGSRSHALRIVFPRELLPIAAIVETDPHAAAREGIGAGVRVVVADVAGDVHVVRAPHPAELEATPGRRAESSLASVRAADIATVADPPSLQALEGIASVCAVGAKMVAFGGVGGRIAILDALSANLAPVAELKPATLARLWNVVSLGASERFAGARAIRSMAQVPPPRRHSADPSPPRLLLAALRADCHVQLWDVTHPVKPLSLVAMQLPSPSGGGGGGDGGGYESGGGPGSPGGFGSADSPVSPMGSQTGGERAAHCMGCGEGYLAVSTYGVDASTNSSDASSSPNTAVQFPRPRDGKISVYALDVKAGPEGSSSASLAFHSPVVGGDGVTVAVAVSGESIWALQEGSIDRRGDSGETLGKDGGAGDRVLKGWPLESLNRAHPCETLGDAAAELGAWAGRAPSDAGAAGAAAALLLRGGAVPGSVHATAADVSDDLASELAVRGVASSTVLTAALDALDQPCPPLGDDCARRAAAATRFAAGGDAAPAADAVAAWSLIAPAYAGAWRRMRAPLGIASLGGGGGGGASNPGGASVVVLREGASCVMRALDATEAAASRAAFIARTPGFAETGNIANLGPGANLGATAPHLAALALGCHMNDLLGAPACHAMDLVAGGAGGAVAGAAGADVYGGGAANNTARASPAARAAVKEAAAFAATEDWLDAAVALALGRVTAQPHGGMDDAVKAALRERRARQRRAAGALRACLVSVGNDPADAIARALDAMEWRHPTSSMEEQTSAGGMEWTEGARAQAARQQAGARCAALRGLLLLLGAIRWGGARVVGAAGCDRGALLALIPRVAAQHRAALLARWLTATPCAGVAADRVAPAPPPPLSAAILPAGAASARPGLSLVVAGAALCAEIVLGVKGVDTYRVDDGGYRRAVEIGAELYAGGELAALGWVLKQARASPPGGSISHGGAGPGSVSSGDAPALLFLQALRASADVARGARDGSSNGSSNGSSDDDATEEALGLFFRAASGIDPGGGDESTGGDVSNLTPGGDVSDAMDVGDEGPRAGDAIRSSGRSDPLLQHLVKLLRSIMSGFPTAPGGLEAGDETSPPVSTLEYYETLMLFFERLGCSLGAARCAHAALREVETAHAEDGSGARSRRAARLWANLLQYSLDLGDWSGAYAAVLSVPGADAQNAALRRLVAALCEPGDVRGGAAALVRLPFGPDALPAVVRALEGRAAAAPLDATPNPSMMLHALHVARGAPGEAAAAVLRHARRLGEAVASAAARAELAYGSLGSEERAEMKPSNPRAVAAGEARRRLAEALEAHCGALLVAINSLRLCPPGARHVAEEWQPDRKLRELTIDGDDDEAGGWSEPSKHDDEKARGPGDENAAPVRSGRPGVRAPPHPKRRRRVPPAPERTSLSRLLREYALAAARLELCAAGAEPAALGCSSLGGGDKAFDRDEADLISGLTASLCAHGLFRAATKLACSWREGEALTELVTVIAATLAARAALAQTRSRGGTSSSLGRLRCGLGSIDGDLGAGCAAAVGEAVAAAAEPPPRTPTASLATAGGVLGSEAIDAAAAEASPAAAWAALRAFLETHCTVERNFAPTEAAARAALAADPSSSLRLPQWLTRRFTRGRGGGDGGAGGGAAAAGGMARRGANPTALLAIYAQHGRLEEAARLAIAELRAHARGADAVTRTRFAAAWFPTPLLMHVRDLVARVPALDGLRAELDHELDEHRRRAEADSAKLAGFAASR